MPGRARSPLRSAALLRTAPVAMALGLLVGCTGGEERPLPGDPTGDAAGAASNEAANEAATAAAVRAGSPPEFHGERPLAVRPARRVFVQPSCTPTIDGDRFCWEESSDPYEPAGASRPVTLTDAEMRLDDLGLDWSVRLTFAEAPPLAAAARAVGTTDDRASVLLLDGDTVLAPLPADAPRGRVVTLTGLEKAEAWDLVELVGGR